MQRTKLSLALASLGVAGLAISHQANAAIATWASGNSDLVFVATDNATGESYYANLGVLSQPPAGIASQTFNVTGSLYSQFLTDVGGDSVSFAVIGGGAVSTTLNSGDSTVGGLTTPSTLVANPNLGQFKLIDINIINPLNGLNGTAQNSGNSYLISSTSTLATSPQYTVASGLQSWNGKATFSTVAPANSTQNFFNFTTGSGGTFGKAVQTLLGTFSYSEANGSVTYAAAGGGAPVPLPAAVWLLGSGLFGLIGIGRRRAAA